MKNQISDNIWSILLCPYCGSHIYTSKNGAICSICNTNYLYTKSGNIDFRLQKPKTYSFDFNLGTNLLPEKNFEFRVLPINNNPEVNYSKMEIPRHLSKEILSHFPKSKKKSSMMLDLGCGNMINKEVCEYAGFNYVGLDNESDPATTNANIIGDAHSLPFKDESFEFILSIAVLEHIRFPFIAIKEAHRVLKKNGILIGTVAFLEPFHGDSFYHHSHLGTYNVLKEGGFKIDKICTDNKYLVLLAQAKMGLFPKMPLFLSKLIIMPVNIIHRIWWKIGSLFSKRASEDIRIRNTAGAFSFIARK